MLVINFEVNKKQNRKRFKILTSMNSSVSGIPKPFYTKLIRRNKPMQIENRNKRKREFDTKIICDEHELRQHLRTRTIRTENDTAV